MRMLTKETRARLQEIITRLSDGGKVTLDERILLQKYSKYIPFVAGSVRQALLKREFLEEKGLI